MQEDIEAIQIRNRKVELDKAWETSPLRRSFIVGITYAVACFWLIFVLKNEQAFLNALVPVGGYIISTLSLPVIKKWWISKQR